MSEKHGNHDNHGICHHDGGSIRGELLTHLPYAIFSVAFSIICLSFLYFFSPEQSSSHSSHRLFHSFHYLHILFAATGTMLTFRRYSKNVPIALFVGFFVPAFFCTFSDAVLPYIGGRMLNLHMHLHWCFIEHLDSVLPFLLAGMLNGWAMSKHPQNRHMFYSIGFHFLHIFISAMASILYLVSFGFHNWSHQMGFVFVYIVFAVLLPCTLADIVVPMLFARLKQSR